MAKREAAARERAAANVMPVGRKLNAKGEYKSDISDISAPSLPPPLETPDKSSAAAPALPTPALPMAGFANSAVPLLPGAKNAGVGGSSSSAAADQELFTDVDELD